MLKGGLSAVRSRFRFGYLSGPGRVTVSAVLAIAAIAFVGYRLASGQETIDSYQYGRDAQQGNAISPVPLQLKGNRPNLVFRGSYLVNAQASCNDCHTCPSYRGVNPYTVGGGLANDPTPINSANFLSGGTPFVNGTILSPSLLPDSSGNPAGLTYAQFKTVMHDGQSAHNPAHILQVMPWPIFRNMYEHDLRSIYEYLKSLPPAPSGRRNCTAPGQTN